MWGGLRGSVIGHGAGSAAASRRGGDGGPFVGMPPELAESVARLLDTEPEHGQPTAVFTARNPDPRPLTLRRLLARRWRLGVTALILLAVESVGYQTGPYLTQIGVDRGIAKGRLGVLVAIGLIYLLTVAVTVAVERMRVRTCGQLAATVMHDLRVRVFTHIQRLSLDYFTSEKAGVTMSRMTADIEVLQHLLQDGIAQFFIQGGTMVIVTAVLFTYNVRLALLTVVIVVPPLTLLSLWFRSQSMRTYLRVRNGLAAVIGDVAESLAGVRVIAFYNRQRSNICRHRTVVGHYRKANFAAAKVAAAYSAGSDLIGLVGQLLLLVIGGAMVVHHELQIGVLVAFILYLGSFFQPIQQLVQLYNVNQQGQAAITKLRELLATEPTVAESSSAYDLPAAAGSITFERVSFGYDPANLVLRDVDIRITAGETVAFVGATGAGKSTIAKLVTRFYDPVSGRVLIDGHDVRDVTLSSLRRQFGLVPQEPFLFTGTIRDNVGFARPDATDEHIRQAIRAVGLEELIDRLPAGIDTPVHERGQSLSSGERQLIALARAFLAEPRVLVLDEATSNLDLKSETKVEAALQILLEGRTAILIAHRLTTAMHADRIIVVDDGRIAESGTHDELVARSGRYASMFASWISQSPAA
ncbi:MAG: ABC transporter ATP-binding protein [Actinobacteria bacterium]|nr:ABC transporter ATP-binding protein [Actinomycetota bacterium]